MVEPIRQVEIQLGHLCNNRCVFCVSGLLSEQKLANKVPFEPVRIELERAKQQGAQRITFLGGEPTIQKSFFDSLAYAKSLGFEEIVIFTNGVLTPLSKFVDRVLALGDFTWRFSLQGGTKQHHDAVTKVQGSFDRIIAGITILSNKGQKITANACITSQNYLSLPDYATLISRYPIAQLHLDMVRPSDAGQRDDDYLKDIMPRYSDLREPLRVLLDKTPQTFDINVGNLPYCILPDWTHRIHHDGNLTFTVAADGRGMLEPAWNKYESKRVDKTHPPPCQSCVLFARCGGVFLKYQQFYGIGEFTPIRHSQLLQLPTSDHHWGWLIQSCVTRLHQQLPPNLKLTASHIDEQKAITRLRFSAVSAVTRPLFDLMLTPKKRMAYPHATTDHTGVQVTYGPNVEETDILTVLQTILDKLKFSAEERTSVDMGFLTKWNSQRIRALRAVSLLRAASDRRTWSSVEVEHHDNRFGIGLVTKAGVVTLRLNLPIHRQSNLQMEYDINPLLPADFQRTILRKAAQLIRAS
ncbi:MAG: radical SAM protein [Myxococcales bacterium]|nr:radical SAM protein [Myxococcales bacterium]